MELTEPFTYTWKLIIVFEVFVETQWATYNCLPVTEIKHTQYWTGSSSVVNGIEVDPGVTNTVAVWSLWDNIKVNNTSQYSLTSIHKYASIHGTWIKSYIYFGINIHEILFIPGVSGNMSLEYKVAKLVFPDDSETFLLYGKAEYHSLLSQHFLSIIKLASESSPLLWSV